MISPVITLAAFGVWHRIFFRSHRGRLIPAVLLTLAAILLVQSQISYRKLVLPGIREFEAGMTTCLIPIGEWLNRNTPAGTVVMVPDIGAVGYFSDRTICDAAGLVSPDILGLLRNGYTQEQLVKERIYRSSYCRADYLVYRSFSENDPVVPHDCEKIFSLPFARMGLAETRVNYYSVYRVR
jgi:hypothetical protein